MGTGTGKFPHASSRGYNYQMIVHEIDGNYTWVEPMKNKSQGEMIRARRATLLQMELQHIVPLLQILDNEISEAYKEEIRHTGMTYQLVPPDYHRRNIAERAIQTWKNNFVSILSGTSLTFLLHLWCRIIPQAERQLLLLSHSNVNTHISSYAHIHGQHDYSA